MTSWLLRAPGSTTCHIDEHNWETTINAQERSMTPEIGWIVGELMMPF
jgi:hypothetical protein